MYEFEPGNRLWPYHTHHANEEWLIVVRGRPTLRTPEGGIASMRILPQLVAWMRANSCGWAAGVALLAVCSLLIAACGGSKTAAASPACKTATVNVAASTAGTSGSWPFSNADLANTRDAQDSTISSANVSRLEQAWTFKLSGTAAAGVGGSGSLAATPIVQAGVVYLQDLDSNVYALAVTSGKLEWEYQCNAPEQSGPGPNGVAVVDGRVYGETPTSVFALTAATGKPIWVNPHVLSKGEGTFGIQPQVADGRVYLASQYGIGPGGGVLIALNASTGAVLWKFNTLLGPDGGVQSVGLGSGGAWETPLVSSDGSVTYGIGNPYQTAAWAIAHPSAQLYTDSEVNLDAATGKLRWYFQGVPNDFKDYDLQASPISARINRVHVVIGAGKMGYLYELNAETGKLIWKTPVGEHNGHDNDSLEALEHRITLKAPYTILPGSLGGVLTNLALADDSVYVVTLDVPLTYTSLSQPAPVKASGRASGEVQALNLTTGKVEWDTKVASVPLGAATVSNDLVFTTLVNGTLLALNRRTGAIAYERKLPTSANSPIAIAGHSVLVPAGGITGKARSRNPQLVAYTVQ
jgi:alcohol dehydrogenase (cytochrome c)